MRICGADISCFSPIEKYTRGLGSAMPLPFRTAFLYNPKCNYDSKIIFKEFYLLASPWHTLSQLAAN